VLNISLADQLGALLGRAHNAHRVIAEEALAPLGLTGKAFGALLLLVEHGPLSQQRLGELQGVDRTTMVGLVDALEHAGYVERRRDPRDRRAYSLQATAKGRRVVPRAKAVTAKAEEEFLAALPAADRRRFKETLRKLLEP
jgi:DNA-binding MarR family transcriptional regulator